MKILVKALCLLLAALPLCSGTGWGAEPSGVAEKTYRIAYIEGGPFSDYQRIFHGMALGLQKLGLIENGDVPLPRDSESMEGVWAWMGEHAGGRRIQFVKDGFYSAGWDETRREEIRSALLRRVREQKDIDVILAFGTWAGKDMAEADIDAAVMVSSVTDAISAGIVPSAEDSGRDNLVAVIEPRRFKRQVEIFHGIFGFKRLGIAYEDTETGRESVALNDIESAAKELGVELVRCTDKFDIPDAEIASERLLQCHKKLIEEGVDAVYITYNIGMTPNNATKLLEPLVKAGVPTFSQLGVPDVKSGVLLSVSQSSELEEGYFSADVLDAIMKGVSPRSISQLFISPISLAMNMNTAKRIGWNPSLEILVTVDEFYNN